MWRVSFPPSLVMTPVLFFSFFFCLACLPSFLPSVQVRDEILGDTAEYTWRVDMSVPELSLDTMPQVQYAVLCLLRRASSCLAHPPWPTVHKRIGPELVSSPCAPRAVNMY